jgi:hypothetical protein
MVDVCCIAACLLTRREKSSAKNKKPAGAYCASGPKGVLCSETLWTPDRARREAVMMMMIVMMRPRVHKRKVKKIEESVNTQ